MEPWQLPATDLVAELRARRLSAVEVLDSIRARADLVEPALNPFAIRLDERAHLAALAADEAIRQGDAGPLAGVPVTIKDSHWLAGVESPAGSVAKAGFVPHETSGAVERLESSGAVIFATTTTSELCYFGIAETLLNGRTSNPWDPSRTCGGSSGGAAVAVAVGAGPLALGGDGGGSIRIPSAFCGTVGFKPSFGAVPREPSSPGWKSLVSLGPMGRTVADVRLAFEAIAGMHPRDRHSIDVAGLDRPAPHLSAVRAVVSEDLGHAPVDDDVRRAFRAAVDRLADDGLITIEASPGLPSSVEVWAAIAAADAWHADGRDFEEKEPLLTVAAADFLRFGSEITAADYVQANYRREEIHHAYVTLLHEHDADVLLTPTVGCEAFPHGRLFPEQIGDAPVTLPWTDWAGFSYDANLAGLPACALPIGFGDDGLPVSMQVLGLRATDGTVLAAAEAIERSLGDLGWPPEGRWTS
jgi:Asp-tRNA(Asn)/Glu-tRNA(Gln) amidotransferase A subunit family amidase